MTDFAKTIKPWSPDRWLIDITPKPALTGFRRFCVEFPFFGVKEARA